MLNPVWGGGQRGAQGRPVRGGGAPQPPAVGVRDPAADLGRLRGRRRLHPERRDAAAARDGHRRHAATRSWRSRPAWSAPPRAARVGVHVDFYPVVDVNNNPRNPIINIRSFGEDVAPRVEDGRGLHQGHPVDGRLRHRQALPRPRRHERRHAPRPRRSSTTRASVSTRSSCVPFKAAIAAGVDAVMSSHIVLPALDPTPGIPATLSRPILTGLLRDELKFDGLIFTDSMTMDAISKMFSHDKAAAMAVKAGVDFVLHSPDDDAAFKGIKAAVAAGEIDAMAQINASVERILRAKARLGLHREPAGRRRRDRGEVRQRGRMRRSRRRSTTGAHAHQGRAQPGAADASRATRTCSTCRCSTTRSGWREGVAEPDDRPRAEAAVAEPHRRRGDGPDDRVGVRAHPRADTARRRRRRGRVRAHCVLQRPDGPEPAADRAARLCGGRRTSRS